MYSKPVPFSNTDRVRLPADLIDRLRFGFQINPKLVTDEKKLLRYIDILWRNDCLFNPLNGSIHNIVKNFYRTGNNNSNRAFIAELRKLDNHSALNQTQKSICIVQAIELNLLGINALPILKKINENCFVQQDNTKGYRGELLASWFLTKFVYKIKEPLEGKIKLSTYFETRNNPLFDEKTNMEVDMVTPDALVSVKFKSKWRERLTSQVRDLFFHVIDNGLQEQVKKLILIRRAVYSYQVDPDYRETNEYETYVREARNEAEKSISERYPKENRSVLRTLNIDIYFVPDIDDYEALKEWIDANYDWTEGNDWYCMHPRLKTTTNFL